MALSASTLRELQQMIGRDASLLARLQGAGDAEQGAALIVAAAAAQGIAVTFDELLAHFATALDPASGLVLSDAQLDSVAGGISNSDVMIIMSTLTFGLGCAITSLVRVSEKKAGCSI